MRTSGAAGTRSADRLLASRLLGVIAIAALVMFPWLGVWAVGLAVVLALAAAVVAPRGPRRPSRSAIRGSRGGVVSRLRSERERERTRRG